MSEWFGTWFDSPYYHMLYGNRDHKEAEQFITTLISYLSPTQGSTFLDLACGKGRHSVQLHQCGMNVLGVDYSQNSIAHAKHLETDGLEFLTHDMRHSFSRKFDYIVNLFTSFGYFDSDQEHLNTLKHVYNGLNDDGVFVLDFLNRTNSESSLVPFEVIKQENISFNISRAIKNGTLIKRIEFHDQGNDYSFQESVRAFTKSDLKNLCNQAGFKLQDTFGDYNLTAFNEDNSKRLILILKK